MTNSDLTVTLLQNDLIWEDPEANRIVFEELIKGLNLSTDLIILPEMFTTGFTMNAEKFAEEPEGPTTQWLQQMVQLTGAAITGSFIVNEQGNFYNRLLWVQPDGQIFTYDKHHLFRMAQENAIYSAGKSKTIIFWKGWRICPLICYDLRFPVWSRQTTEQAYDLLLYVANWPEKRSAAWRSLLPARAVENLSYCIGVNRTGQDGNGIAYVGESAVCDAQGNSFFLPANPAYIHTQTLSFSELQNFRERFPANLDADAFTLN
jgi:omega-amidase